MTQTSILIFLLSGETFIAAETKKYGIPGVLPSTTYLSSPVKIIPVEARPLNDTTGLSNGYKQCGGTGQLVDWRIGDCIPIIPGPCSLEAEKLYHPETTFIASKNYDKLDFKVVESIVGVEGDPYVAWAKSVNEVPIVEGGCYVLTAGLTHTPSLRGKVITTKIFIYREEDNSEELCASVDWTIV